MSATGSQPTKSRLKNIVQETTAGGVIYRKTAAGQIEILVIEDAKGRWTLPKGHVESGETYRQTASREITEETGLEDLEIGPAIKPVNFQYRRGSVLVLMTLHLFVIRAVKPQAKIRKEAWMKSIAWQPAPVAIDLIQYEDICRAILLALRHIRKLEAQNQH